MFRAENILTWHEGSPAEGGNRAMHGTHVCGTRVPAATQLYRLLCYEALYCAHSLLMATSCVAELQEPGPNPPHGFGRKVLDNGPFHGKGVINAQSSQPQSDTTSIVGVKFKVYQIILMVISGSIFMVSFSAAAIVIVLCTPFGERVRSSIRIKYEKMGCLIRKESVDSSKVLDCPEAQLFTQERERSSSPERVRSTGAQSKCSAPAYAQIPSSGSVCIDANCKESGDAFYAETANSSRREELTRGSHDATNSHCEAHQASSSAVSIGSIAASTDALTGKTKKQRTRKPNFHLTAAQRRMLDGTNDFINTQIPREASPSVQAGANLSAEPHKTPDSVHEQHACAAELPSVREGHACAAEEARDIKAETTLNAWQDHSDRKSVV